MKVYVTGATGFVGGHVARALRDEGADVREKRADLPLSEVFAAVADLAGRSRPRLRVPYGVALAAAKAGIVNENEVRLARLPMYYSSEKARDRLGYEPGPVAPALARAVAEAVNVDGKGGR